MKCEVIAIGTELLLGQIVDTNSSWMGEHLALAGIDSHFQTKVGDNFGRMTEALELALLRSDAIIMCGGLGPTQDDITRDVIAHVLGVDLVRDESIVEKLENLFRSRGRDMPVSNLRQADIPKGCWIIEQMPGTAPGLVCPYNRDGVEKVIYAVPGVPFEMRIMLEGTVIPELRKRSGDSATIKSRTLKTWGISEARLGEVVAPRLTMLDETGRATIAFLASGIEGLKVRVTAKASTDAAVDAILDEEEMALRAILGDLVFGIDEDSMESVVLQLLREKGCTLAVAESLTGGMVESRLTMIPSAGDILRGGVVSYHAEVKREVLGVSPGPVVREQTAREMASGVRRLLRADVGLSTTGAAGPDPLDGHDPGSVFLGIDIKGDVSVDFVKLPGDRERVREYAVINLLNHLRLRLLAVADD